MPHAPCPMLHMSYQAPLYGRLTAQLPVGPLPFTALKDFFPGYPVAERVAVYAVVGGVPAYPSG